MDDEIEEFERLLDENDPVKATAKYYKAHARKIIVGIVSAGVIIALALSDLPVGVSLSVIALLTLANYLYGKVK